MKGFTDRSEILASLDIAPDLGKLEPEAELTIFRIVQESLNNIHRHSESRTAAVSLARGCGEVLLEINDSGKGMDLNLFESEKEFGVGIASMKKRVKKLNGNFEIASSPGDGVTIRASLPAS